MTDLLVVIGVMIGLWLGLSAAHVIVKAWLGGHR